MRLVPELVCNTSSLVLVLVFSLVFYKRQEEGTRGEEEEREKSAGLAVQVLSTHFLPFISVFPTHPTFKDFTFSCSIPPVQWLFLTKLNIFLGIFYAFHSSLRGKLIWNAPQLKGKSSQVKVATSKPQRSVEGGQHGLETRIVLFVLMSLSL